MYMRANKVNIHSTLKDNGAVKGGEGVVSSMTAETTKGLGGMPGNRKNVSFDAPCATHQLLSCFPFLSSQLLFAFFPFSLSFLHTHATLLAFRSYFIHS